MRLTLLGQAYTSNNESYKHSYRNSQVGMWVCVTRMVFSYVLINLHSTGLDPYRATAVGVRSLPLLKRALNCDEVFVGSFSGCFVNYRKTGTQVLLENTKFRLANVDNAVDSGQPEGPPRAGLCAPRYGALQTSTQNTHGHTPGKPRRLVTSKLKNYANSCQQNLWTCQLSCSFMTLYLSAANAHPLYTCRYVVKLSSDHILKQDLELRCTRPDQVSLVPRAPACWKSRVDVGVPTHTLIKTAHLLASCWSTCAKRD